MDLPFPEGTKLQQQEPAVVQIDPKCLHSALKEFFEPLRTNDSRTDFFALYRRESAEFDRDYAKKYDEDLNTSLIFAGLFSAVSSAFIIDVQSKLEPDPNEMTAAYMRILIHAVNSSLFPDANPDSVTWTGPPPEIVTVQSLLYASLATSLFAAFLAMLGKQWVNRYLRNRGGSNEDKSRDRQLKLDGFDKWHFHLAIESLPVMLQVALLWLACGLSRYLWTISRTIAGVILAMTLFGITLYIFLTLAATFYYNCPYQTPPSILTRTFIKYLTRSDTEFARSLRSLIAFLPSIQGLKKIPRLLRSGVRSVVESFGCVPTITEEAEDIPLAVVLESPNRIFEDISINWEVCKADTRCISWMLESTTDPDVILSTVRFTADMIWYPEIAGALSPHILADLFFDCLSDGRVIPGKLEHAGSIGMALATVLSIRLNMEPEGEGLRELCNRLNSDIKEGSSSKRTFTLVIGVLKFIATALSHLQSGVPVDQEIFSKIPDLSTMHKLWLSRVILQTIWRCRHAQDPATVLKFWSIDALCVGLMADSDETPVILRTNCFLIMAITLGHRINIRDLYPPSNIGALKTAIFLFHQQFRLTIREGKAERHPLRMFIFMLARLNPFQVVGIEELGFIWMAEILSSGYPEEYRYHMASRIVEMLGKHFFPQPPVIPPSHVKPVWIPPLLDFLSLCEKLHVEVFPPYPGPIALRMLSTIQYPCGFAAAILPVLASTLLPTNPLESRNLALKVFHTFMAEWFSPQIENILNRDLNKLLRAVGDPFQRLDLPLQDGQPADTGDDDSLRVTVILMEFASSDLWGNHLCYSNFASCEWIVSTDEGRIAVLKCMLRIATFSLPDFLDTPTKIIAAIRRLEELQCFSTAEIIIMWAWTIGIIDPENRVAWKSIQDETLRFYQNHRFRCLVALARIIDTIIGSHHECYLEGRYVNSPCRVWSLRLLPRTSGGRMAWDGEWSVDLRVSQACQLRGLYHLFGYDPTTWREAVAVEEASEGTKALSKCSVASASSADWEYNYP